MGKMETLKASPLFANLNEDEMEMVGELCKEKTHKPGEVIFHQGDVGDSLYIVQDGEVDILREDPNGEAKVIATIGQGDFFGEMSLIDKDFRSATVAAKNEAEVLNLTNDDLHSFAKVYKNGFTLIVINIARVLSRRLRETSHRLASRL
jgi:CRP-like cAMP-binding protein